jgi:hypothetical protein
MSQDFGSELPNWLPDFNAPIETDLNNKRAPWSTDNSSVQFTQAELIAYGIEDGDPDGILENLESYGQHQHGATVHDEPPFQQPPPQLFRGTPPPPYTSFQAPVNYADAHLCEADTHSALGGSFGCIPPHPVLAPPEAKPYGLTFRNLAEAKENIHCHIESDWLPPGNDGTIPTTDQERAAYVSELLSAMKDTSTCSDNRDKARFIKCCTPGTTKAFRPEQLEKVCWQLVNIAEKLHVNGPLSLSIYERTALDTVRKSRFLTFARRMHHLCALLRLSKSRCFSLLKGENLETTVGAPAQRYSGTLVNDHQNGNRQKYIKEGRSAVKGKEEEKNKMETATAAKDQPSNTNSDQELVPNAAMSLQASEPLADADVGNITFGGVQSSNIQSVSQYAGDNSGQYENNQNVTGNSYYHAPSPKMTRALPSYVMPYPSMEPPPAPPPTPSFMPPMAVGYPGMSYTHPYMQPPPIAPKRSAEDADLDASPDVRVHRPWFNNQESLYD